MDAAWTWVDACNMGIGCVFESWSGTAQNNVFYGMPNMTNTTNITLKYSCIDLDLTDGNGCISNSGCRLVLQRSTVGAWGTVATTGQGTATDPIDCGGKACSVTNVNTTCFYNASEPNETNGTYIEAHLERTLRVYRTNLTGSNLRIREQTDSEVSPTALFSVFRLYLVFIYY